MGKTTSKLKQKMTDQQRIEFAKQIEMLYEAAHASTKKIFLLSLLKGVATGLGVFLGGTLVVALLLWILSLAGHVPFIGEVSQSAEQSIQQSKESKAH